jgi:hypothetical protein
MPFTHHGNVYAREGVDFCLCGAKYWEKDVCVSPACRRPYSDTWSFEPADPEVGILADDVVHTCHENPDGCVSAVEAAHWVVDADDATVVETTVYECPPCGARYGVVETWPRWMFEEPGRLTG